MSIDEELVARFWDRYGELLVTEKYPEIPAEEFHSFDSLTPETQAAMTQAAREVFDDGDGRP